MQSLKTQQVQNMTPQYHQQDAVMQQYQHQPHQMEQQEQQQRVLKIKINADEVPKKNRRSKKLKNTLKSCKFY